jgi:hypothetical protein
LMNVYKKKEFLISQLWYFQWTWIQYSTKTNRIFPNTGNSKQDFQSNFGPEILKNKSV